MEAKTKQSLFEDFFWGILGDILIPIAHVIGLVSILVSFAVWQFLTRIIPWFFVLIFPITKKLLPVLVVLIFAGTLRFLEFKFPDAGIWMLYVLTIPVWAFVYILTHTIK
ncbi:MAG: hypothetical protein WCJ39_01835 [bacterium]